MPTSKAEAVPNNAPDSHKKFTFDEFEAVCSGLKTALVQYSQPFIQGKRQLDPDKLSQVMFLCGMSQIQDGGKSRSVIEALNLIDSILEDSAITTTNQKLMKIYEEIFAKNQQ